VKPPPVLDGARVLRYAVTKPPVRFSGRTHLLIDGRELGRMSKLVVVESLYGDGIWLQHCDDEWNVVGTSSGFRTVAEALRRAERMYPGIRSAWVNAHVTRAEAKAHEKKVWRGHQCNFCGKLPPQVKTVITGRGATICDECVREFYEDLNRD